MSKSAAATRSRTQNGASRVRTFDSVEGITARQTEAMRQRLKESAEQTARLQNISQKLEDALARNDIDQVKILNADYASAKANQDETRKSIAQASMALMDGYKEIGVVLKEAKDLTAEEKSLITQAQEKAAQAKTRLDDAEKALAASYNKTTLFGFQARAVERATKVRDAAKSEYETLETAIKTAEQAAERMRHNRLEGASLEQSLQHMQAMTTEVVGLIRDDIENINENLDVAVNGITDVTQTLEKLSRDMEAAKTQRDELSARIDNLRAERDEVADKTSSQWQELNSKVVAAERERDQAEADHNIAFDLFQNAQAFLEKYRHQEAAQRTALQFNQAFIASLEAGTKYRDDIYRSHIGVLKSGDLFRAGEMMDQAARRVDEDISVDVMTQTTAMRNSMAKRYEDLPEDIKRHREITEAGRESEAKFDATMRRLVEEAQKALGTPTNYDARGEVPAQ